MLLDLRHIEDFQSNYLFIDKSMKIVGFWIHNVKNEYISQKLG